MAYDLQQRLDAFVSGECNLSAFVQELCVLCDARPEFAWDVLSLIDQYYRRGKLSTDLFRTIKNRIEQHVLGVPDSATGRELPDAPAVTEALQRVAHGDAVAIVETQEHTASPRQSVSEVRKPRTELPQARRPVHRLQEYRAILADYGRRSGAVLAITRRGLGVWGSRTRSYCERLTSVELRRSLREHVLPPCVVFGILATVLLGIDSSPLPQDLPKDRDRGTVFSPPAAAVVIPQSSEPGEISLSADRYVVFPGHSSAEIEVHRTAGVHGDVSFVWWTQRSIGARPARDYVSRTPQTARLPDGVDTLHLSVPILANPSRKHTEFFYVVIGDPGGGASLGSIRRAAVFIMGPD